MSQGVLSSIFGPHARDLSNKTGWGVVTGCVISSFVGVPIYVYDVIMCDTHDLELLNTVIPIEDNKSTVFSLAVNAERIGPLNRCDLARYTNKIL